MTSADYLADTQPAKLNTDPGSGEELEKTVDRMFNLRPTVAGRLKEVLK